MARAVLRHFMFGAAATGLLMGCVNGGPGGKTTKAGDGAAGLVASPARAGGAAREVEAPEVFQTTDNALWDGRPSLGGIWVASPDVTDPERVVMVNTANGQTVTGALFRRERDNPGPKLQISSDAAEALGMLAGQPTELRVTALRKVEEEAPPVVEAEAAEVAEAPVEGATPADASAAETAALATAALEATEAGTDAAAAAAPDGAVEAVAASEPPKRKTWKERRAEAKAKREAEKAAKAAAEAGGTAEPAVADAGQPNAESAGVAAVETAPLDARAPEVAAAAEEASAAPAERKTRRQIRAEEEAAAREAAEAAAAAPVAEAAPQGRPIQVASFSSEANATRAAEALAKLGVSARPVRSERGGKAVWGVVAMGDGELLKKIKGAGFADAYFLQ